MLGLGRKNKAAEEKIDKSTQELLNLRVKIQEAENKISQSEMTLKLKQQEFDLKRKADQHEFELEKKALKAELELEKKLSGERMKHQEETLKKDFEMQTKELKITTQLETDQKLAQMKIDNEKKINELTAEHQKTINEMVTKHATEKTEYQKKLQEENYTALSEGLKKINTDGNAQTKFVQDLTMAMIDKHNSNIPRLETSHTHTHIEKTVSGDIETEPVAKTSSKKSRA